MTNQRVFVKWSDILVNPNREVRPCGGGHEAEKGVLNMRMKTSELSGAALDWAVGECEYRRIEASGEHVKAWVLERHRKGEHTDPYSTDWALGGPIIERKRIRVAPNIGGSWTATIRHEETHPLVSYKVLAGLTHRSGPTSLVAATRCFVASEMGDEVDVPQELLS